MNRLLFTRYHRPHGTQEEEWILIVDESFFRKAIEVMAAGGMFTVENLPNGAVSTAVEYSEEDIAVQVIFPGQSTQRKYNALIKEAYQYLVSE